MTKYVLNSGNVRGNKEKAKKYFAEVFKGLDTKPKVLLCFFANPREEWEVRFQKFTQDFPNYLSSAKKPAYELALPDLFEKQCKECDVIWIHGGDDHLVQYWLKQFDLGKIWDSKVVAVSSASSDALVGSFWTCDWRQCLNGLNLIPIKFIPHYNSSYGDDDPRGPIDWDEAKQTLIDYGNKKLPIYALEEGDYIVIER